ncbi:MAG: hypothetical protein N2D54_06650, partial [Chloroflexota bacterium]
MNIKQSIRYSLITFGLIFYLNVLGIPLTAEKNAVPFFIFVVGLMSFLQLRPKAHEEAPKPAEQLIQGLIIGLISGLGLLLVTMLFANYQANGIKINALFARVLPDHTANLASMTKEDILAGVNILPAMIRVALMLTTAGVVGAGLTLLRPGKEETASEPKKGSALKVTLAILLPLAAFGAFMALKLESVQVAGSEENVLGLFIVYIFMGTALVAMRQEMPRKQKTGLAV